MVPSWIFFLLVVASFATRTSAATFTVRNNCGFTVWPAAIPVGGGTQLNPGWTWTFDAPPGTSGRVWGRSGCSFNGWWGHCDSGDCGGAYSCSLSGQPPATLAEFTIVGGDGHDYYDISVVDGYNLPMDFSCSSGVGLQCRGSGCRDAYLYPTDDSKTHACDGNSNYQVTFCP
ncbi:hypothetical protein SEVIR_3G417400v4 [Setaria viridis]|nr:thaumatin-like pathogenesis-related protein 4 [Setaria italica]XP_034588241.1 thaumatin-like pathogenesis-related protein 4 [Setaria viridis]RCV19612.1 hypothetical protein SETIT_3G399800v2 [Setaria italica]TKW29770.1 hypothetical protein SEVIR_3G417400v2 [Setaria viridis]